MSGLVWQLSRSSCELCSHRLTTVLRISHAGLCTSFSKKTNNTGRYSLQYHKYKQKLRNESAAKFIESRHTGVKEKLRELQINYEVMKAEGQHEIPDEMMPADWLDMLNERCNKDIMTKYKSLKSEHIHFEEWKSREWNNNLELIQFLKKYKKNHRENMFMFFDELIIKQREYLEKKFSDFSGYRCGRDIILEFPSRKVSSGTKRTPSFSDKNSKQFEQTVRLVLEMNQLHSEPCRFHIANCGEMDNSKWRTNWNSLDNIFPFITCHGSSACDVFPRDRLVYVTASSPNLFEDNPENIPVIMHNNMFISPRLVQEHAESQGLRHACFPLHRYVKFIGPSKDYAFTTAESVGVLQDVFLTHDWSHAITSNILLPKSKYYTAGEFREYVYNNRQIWKKTSKEKLVKKYM